jgi:hypothetical protein
MNEKMLQLLVTDQYLDNSKGVSKFEYIYTQQINLRVANDSSMKEEVRYVISTLEDKETSVKVAGSFRRNNMFLDELTFLVINNNKKSTIKRCSEEIEFESIINDRATRIIKVGTSYLFESFIFINEREYIPSLIKYTGSSQFYKLYKERMNEKGINKLDLESEQEVFDLLEIPYLSPELRDCIDDLSIPYSSFILEKNEKISGNIIPFTKLSEYKNFDGIEYLGLYVTLDEYLKLGKGIVTLLKTSHIEGVGIYVGIKLNSIRDFEQSLQEDFDFVICSFDTDNVNEYTAVANINKCIIIESFKGVLLANPLKTVLLKTEWEHTLRSLAKNNVVIGINSGNIISSLHPYLLNIFKKSGGEVIVYNSEADEFGNAIHLLRKALFSRKSLVHNHFRFHKMMERQNARV